MVMNDLCKVRETSQKATNRQEGSLSPQREDITIYNT